MLIQAWTRFLMHSVVNDPQWCAEGSSKASRKTRIVFMSLRDEDSLCVVVGWTNMEVSNWLSCIRMILFISALEIIPCLLFVVYWFSPVQTFFLQPLVLCRPPGSSDRGILQARMLEWVAIPFSRVSSPPRDPTHLSCIARWILYHWARREAHSMLILLRKI